MNAPVQQEPLDAISARLRGETAASHRALEAALNMLAPEFDFARYRETVRGFHAFLHPLLTKASALIACEDVQAVNPLRHLARLDRDMAALQVPARKFASGEDLPMLGSAAQAWAALYVIEGSTLGARILAPHFQTTYGIDANTGCAYFCGDMAEDGLRGLSWPQFRDRLDRSAPVEHAQHTVVAAEQTFRQLQRWLESR